MEARDLLTVMQRGKARVGQAYDDLVRQRYLAVMEQADPRTRPYLAENLARNDATYARYLPRLPTPMQSVQDYVRLSRAKERLDVTLKGGGDLPPRDNVVIGSVETEQLNALSMHWAASDEYLIVFNRALFVALLRVCNYVTCAFTVDDEIERDQIVRLAPAYRELLTAVTEARLPDPGHTFALFGAPDVREAEYRNLRWQLREDFVADFLFAHEYMHVLLGHLTSAGGAAPTEDHGGWDHEYEADSIGLELFIHTWMNLLRGEPVPMTWLLQSVSLFFVFVAHVERYRAEVLGRPDGVWRHDRSHPPTWVRYGRLVGDISRYPYLPWDQIHPRLRQMEDCLEWLYDAAVGVDVAPSAASMEWRFQRLGFESLPLGLLPQHLVVVARCVQSALRSKAVPDLHQMVTCTAEVNHELEAHGISRLTDLRQSAAGVVTLLSRHALGCAQTVGSTAVDGFADELARIALRDARTRYPYRAH